MSQGSNKRAPTSDGAGTLTFWRRRQEIAIQSRIETAMHKQQNHDPEYLSKYPNECRDCKPGICHPEAVKRITKDMQLKQQHSEIPTVIRPTRLNR